VARINVEESIHKDARFFNLAVSLGSRERAMGALVYAWILAQTWWKSNDRLIPLNEWKRNITDGDEIVRHGLATIIDEKVRVSGADTQFRWLEQRIEAGRKNKGKSRKRSLNGAKRNRTVAEPLTLTPSLNTKEIHVVSPNGDDDAFDFESLYQQYPKRGSGKDMQKSKGMDKCLKQICTPERFTELSKAVANYSKHVRQEKTKDPTWDYSVMWSTFMARTYWPDWINPEAPEKRQLKTIDDLIAEEANA